MDLHDYIESGIIESYLLGLVSADEAELFERMRSLYPELNTEVAAVEYKLQKIMVEGGVTPPAKVWNKIAERLTPHHKEGYYAKAGRKGEAGEPLTYVLQPRNNTMTISIWWRCAFIALVVVVMALTASTFYFYQQFRNMEERLLRLYPAQLQQVQPARQ
ncbi:hypothetical protein SAMN05428949_3664 [Chitinophaga sp. YR627]|uniref:hypothetical protein n=1 Tax=Chitinophaga sp. YR627 TaxID=1881041 RepID=UPI0008ED6C95|nr:hypothetical protein [Chitinophaga sp. YR627]SFN85440.1 hypothetical protein SAMN05428949_3664 [Chitinophaga sp. YR627]